MLQVALILGGADCVWCDMGELERLVPSAGWADYITPKPCFARKTKKHRIPMNWPGPVIAINDIGVVFPGRIDHWVSLHPVKFPKWERMRARKRFPKGYVRWGKVGRSMNTDRTVEQWTPGYGGMFAATVARDGLGCEKAILCGVGMTNGPHFVGSTEHTYGKKWLGAAKSWPRWEKPESKARMMGWLKSMSGNTRKLLGAPTAEWLNGEVRKVA